MSEKILRIFLRTTHHSKISSKDVHRMIHDIILQTVHSGNYDNLFKCLNQHSLNYSFFNDHKYLIIKSICEKFLQLRIHYVIKNAVVEKQCEKFVQKIDFV